MRKESLIDNTEIRNHGRDHEDISETVCDMDPAEDPGESRKTEEGDHRRGPGFAYGEVRGP